MRISPQTLGEQRLRIIPLQPPSRPRRSRRQGHILTERCGSGGTVNVEGQSHRACMPLMGCDLGLLSTASSPNLSWAFGVINVSMLSNLLLYSRVDFR